jgi:hypothetical protein
VAPELDYQARERESVMVFVHGRRPALRAAGL